MDYNPSSLTWPFSTLGCHTKLGYYSKWVADILQNKVTAGVHTAKFTTVFYELNRVFKC